MAGQLHEVLAVLPSCKATASKIVAETKKTFTDKQGHFQGLLKTYEPLEEDGQTLDPERSPLVTTVGEKLAHLAEIYTPWLDAEFQVDVSNTAATATVEVDGFKVENVPATFLMQWDKRLSELRDVYNNIPTLDPKHEWKEATDKGKGIFEAVLETRNRSEKTLAHKVLVPATPEHPAQVQVWNEDRVVGRFVTLRSSGSISPGQKYELLKRIDAMQRAVKRALSAANRTEHSKVRVGESIFKFINGDLPLKR